MTVRPGTVYLVGAGPGDPGLITVRGLELLQRADVVAHDRLVDDALLAHAPHTSECIDVGKRHGDSSSTQERINTLIVERAKRGLVVVRLKGGDPLIFGRGYEEFCACREADVPCEIVPGITSALAAPTAAGIPVTLRGAARSVAVVTAETGSGEFNDNAIASVAHADTIVILMGVRRLARIIQTLIDAGRHPSTPAALIERGTLPGQREVRSELHLLENAAHDAGIRAPAVIVIGETTRFGGAPTGPLSGRRVVVTRPMHAAHELTDSLRSLGAEVIISPLIRIEHVEWVDRDAMQALDEFDWLVFTSRHGVRGFRRALERCGRDVRALGHFHIATVGPITARELEAWSLRADICPAAFRAEALCDELLAFNPRPRRVLFPCGTLALETVPQRMGMHGIPVTPLVVYRTVRTHPDNRGRSEIERGVDAILLASPSAAAALVESNVEVRDAAIICIGATTASAAASIGLRNIHVAAEHTDAGLVSTTINALSGEAVKS